MRRHVPVPNGGYCWVRFPPPRALRVRGRQAYVDSSHTYIQSDLARPGVSPAMGKGILRHVAAHLLAAPSCKVSRTPAAGTDGGDRRPAASIASVSALGTEAGTLAGQPLTTEQLRAFAADGFVALPLADLDPALASAAYVHAAAAHAAAGGVRHPDPGRAGDFAEDGPLRTPLDAVLSSAVTRGALASLLGPDFACAGAWAGGPGYGGSTSDQAFHKDDTHVPVRDHRVRSVSLFFLPGEVEERMGPTQFVRSTQYLAMDREGFSHGEERLDPQMRPPKTLAGWHRAITSWDALGTGSLPGIWPGQTVTVPALGYAERDERLRAAPAVLGCTAADVAQATCRGGGTIVIW